MGYAVTDNSVITLTMHAPSKKRPIFSKYAHPFSGISYLVAHAMEWADSNYGSIEGYLHQEIGLTNDEISQLHDMYLK